MNTVKLAAAMTDLALLNEMLGCEVLAYSLTLFGHASLTDASRSDIASLVRRLDYFTSRARGDRAAAYSMAADIVRDLID